MIMRRKKNIESEKNMAENKPKSVWRLFLAEFFILLIGTCGVWFLGNIKGIEQDRLLGSSVMTLLGLAVTGFHYRREYLRGSLDYDNESHVFRFWFCVGIGLGVAFICGFLPVSGWPFLVVFVTLSLFSNMSTGILSASVLLLISVNLSGGNELGFALYLVSGAFAVTLFRHLEKDFHFGIPFFLSILCLLVCETAGVVLVINARPDLEMFVIPVVNIILSSILLLGCMKLFSSTVLYRHREHYLDINDTENPILAEFREKDKREYMCGIHVAHFCERIGQQFPLDNDALKCAAYYHRLGEGLEELLKKKFFPSTACEIIKEYRAGRNCVTRKETAVLMISDMVVTSVSDLFQKEPDRKVDYPKLIDEIFNGVLFDGSLNHCRITMEEFRIMQRIFREEELYYDFLR